MPNTLARAATSAPGIAVILAGAVALVSGCGSDSQDTSNGVISSTPSTLSFAGGAPDPQTISIAYVAPPTQVVLAGYPPGVNPTCIGSGATCRLSITLASAIGANPLIFSVTILDTTSSHTSTLRFVSTDFGYQTNHGYVDVTVTYTP